MPFLKGHFGSSPCVYYYYFLQTYFQPRYQVGVEYTYQEWKIGTKQMSGVASVLPFRLHCGIYAPHHSF